MKHLLIILISILLLSSPVIGDNHKGETLYMWGKYPDYVWKGFGEKETHPKYEGEVSNGKPNGFGVLTYPYDEKSVVGEWKNGKYDGQVILTFPDGEKYEGEYKDGLKHGQGTYTWNDGEKYVGEWKDGRKHGQGTYTQYGSLLYPDGRKYVGEYKNGKEWNGTYYDNNGKKEYKLVNGEIE